MKNAYLINGFQDSEPKEIGIIIIPIYSIIMSSQKQNIVMADDRLSCLVVDDNPLNLTMAQSFLHPHNIKAETANSGPEALSMIEKKASSDLAYDIIFLDHMMPEMDGIETTKRIREWENKTGQNKQMPIVALRDRKSVV